MAIMDPIKPQILSVRIIPNVDSGLAQKLKLRPDQRSLGLITCTIDDALYVSIDEGTKMADVEVVYAKSFYAGSAHASGPLSGEIIAIFAGPDPAEVRAALAATRTYAENEAWFYAADESGSNAFFAHTISRTGSYLSGLAGIAGGKPLAYLIACPLEATFGLDAALKAADVEMKVWFEPPSETNFSGGLLTGSQSACKAACDAFREAVIDVANNPIVL
ncbi:ethanolamine utilization microcompartment protein EutL [uncultured Desulfosarcina sp.]|uniref:ethanolamine utilization microcompartment protein EutL n=1 Tax=uncultured Desulfosarcina sp. TaxID=218289 RepID=UPI0029C6588B|nr:ethanolamine utilization microcompartment protein EutL [uncultured Desulfosarcina sp.]